MAQTWSIEAEQQLAFEKLSGTPKSLYLGVDPANTALMHASFVYEDGSYDDFTFNRNGKLIEQRLVPAVEPGP